MASKYTVTPSKNLQSDNQNSEEEEEEEEEETIIFRYERVLPDEKVEKVEEVWSAEHAKILYLMSKYAKAARIVDDTES